MKLPHTRISIFIDRKIKLIGDCLSWVWLVLLGIIVLNVVLRYFFGQGRIEFEEVQWHLYSLGFLLGLSYAYSDDVHIRVDVLRANFSPRLTAWIELYGILILLLPFVLLIIYFGIPFVTSSHALGEVSQAPGGLPHRWLIKAALPFGFLLLLAAVVARFTRLWSFLFFDNQSIHEQANGR
ncbi:MAG: TRAP transporter small permease subunit [Gammaproteobacteria bacterium]